MTHLSLILL